MNPESSWNIMFWLWLTSTKYASSKYSMHTVQNSISLYQNSDVRCELSKRTNSKKSESIFYSLYLNLTHKINLIVALFSQQVWTTRLQFLRVQILNRIGVTNRCRKYHMKSIKYMYCIFFCRFALYWELQLNITLKNCPLSKETFYAFWHRFWWFFCF